MNDMLCSPAFRPIARHGLNALFLPFLGLQKQAAEALNEYLDGIQGFEDSEQPHIDKTNVVVMSSQSLVRTGARPTCARSPAPPPPRSHAPPLPRSHTHSHTHTPTHTLAPPLPRPHAHTHTRAPRSFARSRSTR